VEVRQKGSELLNSIYNKHVVVRVITQSIKQIALPSFRLLKKIVIPGRDPESIRQDVVSVSS